MTALLGTPLHDGHHLCWGYCSANAGMLVDDVCDSVLLEIVCWHLPPISRPAVSQHIIWQHPYTHAKVSNAVAAGYRTRDLLLEPVGVHPSVSRLEMPAPWLAELSADLEEVMNAESLELQAIFNSDHLVCFLVLCQPFSLSKACRGGSHVSRHKLNVIGDGRGQELRTIAVSVEFSTSLQ